MLFHFRPLHNVLLRQPESLKQEESLVPFRLNEHAHAEMKETPLVTLATYYNFSL